MDKAVLSPIEIEVSAAPAVVCLWFGYHSRGPRKPDRLPDKGASSKRDPPMNADWRAFLEARGARIDPERGALFDAGAAAEPDAALVDLSELGLIAVAGPETLDFLQGQVSNDLRELSDAHSQLSCHCTAKGRMLANFRALRIEESIVLVLPRTQLPALLKRLKMFVLRAKVQVDDASDALVCAGVIGAAASAALGATFGELPANDNGLARNRQTMLIRVAGPTPRWLLIGPADQVQAIWETLAETVVQVNPDLWALYDIRAGIPVIRQETSDAFVPQMTNMQLIDGVSFHKGCYTGQEVVTRMQYLGKLKRRMYHAEVETETTPRPGDPVKVADSRSEQASDRIVDARQVGPNRWELLVVCEIAAAEGGQVRLGPDGPVLRLTPPPYGFPAPIEPQPAGSAA